MKTSLAIVALLAMLIVSGCWTFKTKSPQGGIRPIDEEFAITVPSSSTVKQGAELTVTVELIRGGFFKQDVQLAVTANGITVNPSYVLLKASDKPEVRFQVVAAREAAIGKYRVDVKGTPVKGKPTETSFIVEVIAQ